MPNDFTLRPHQVEAIKRAKPILNDRRLVYIFGQPRIGKSLISLELAKEYGRALVLTKKNAIPDWQNYHPYNFDAINYEALVKYSPKYYDIVIVDEAHNFSAIPKPSLRIKQAREFCRGKPLILLSGTPLVETPLAAYPQLSLSSYSPFGEFNSFYRFFDRYGIPSLIHLYGRSMESYSKCKVSEIMAAIEPFIVRVSYMDAGFVYNNTDCPIVIDPPEDFKRVLTQIKSTSFIGKKALETSSALLQCLHQVEGGFYEKRPLRIAPKVQWLQEYIKSHPGRTAIMSYFIGEQENLSRMFESDPNVTVLSSTKYCEGIDLSDYDHFILYSFGYSGAKFIQLRDRVVNITQTKATRVIIPLLKGGICAKIYEAVSSKRNFNLKNFNI